MTLAPIELEKIAHKLKCDIDAMIGQIFHNLTVISGPYTGTVARKKYWECQCSCGNRIMAATGSLKSKNTRSCGCSRAIGKRIRHGHSSGNGYGRSLSPEYHSWSSMRTRCTNPNYKQFKDYGGRGITVCERWNLFENFLVDMRPRPKGLTLERNNNDGNYEPSNCRWATRKEQQNNKRNRPRHA